MQSELHELKSLLDRPIKLVPHSFRHFYNGGKLRAEFLGEEVHEDDYRPEAWILSTNEASTPGRENDPKEGYSRIDLPSGRQITIDVLLNTFPIETLGQKHWSYYNSKLGILLKIFDVGATERIPIHWHPTPFFAREYLSSRNGKNEAWIIIGIRDRGTAWVGWKDQLTKQDIISFINNDSIAVMRSYMHEVNLSIGDVLSIPAGMAHAIGSGVCVLEPQEPTDFSIIAEHKRFPVTEEECHLGLGWDRAVDALDLNATEWQVLRRRIMPGPVVPWFDDEGNSRIAILSEELRPYFWAERALIATEMDLSTEGFQCITVLSGTGFIERKGPFENTLIHKGDSFFVPAAVDTCTIVNSEQGKRPLALICCYPPSSKYSS